MRSKYEFPLAKTLFYCSLLGFFCSAVLLFILNNFLFDYYSQVRDDSKQMFEGGALTAVALYFIIVGFLDPEEITKMGFPFGILLLFTLALGGYFFPLFIVGILSILFSFTEVTWDFFNFFLDFVGPFCIGGTTVGFLWGVLIWRHYNGG